MLGPIDYVVVGFEGNKFDGSIMEELQKAVDKQIVRVIDLLFIVKDQQGDIRIGELTDQSPEFRETLANTGVDREMPLLSEADIEKIAVDMPNETAAGVLLVEQLWAKGFKQAVADAGGFLIADGRIHSDAVASALDELDNETD